MKPSSLPPLSNRDIVPVVGIDGLVLRPLDARDHESLVTILLSPTMWQQGFGDGFEGRPTTRAEAYQFLYQQILTPDREVFAIDLNRSTIGICSYFQCEPENARVEVGKLVLHESHWGRGYMGAALDALVRHAFNMGYHRVSAEADELNKRSIRSLSRAGFVLEGIRRHSSFHADGSRRDICLFSLTLDDEEVLARLRVKLPT